MEPLPRSLPRLRRPGWRKVVEAVAGMAIAASLLVWGLPHFAGTSWARIFSTLDQVGPGTAVELFALMVGGLWFYTFTLTGSLPGLSHGRALIVNVCGSSVGNLLPGGGAAGVAATFALCRSWGFTRRDISTSIIVSGVWNVLARVAVPVIGLIALLLDAGTLPVAAMRGGVIGAAAGVVLLGIFVAVIASRRAATWVGHRLDRALRPLSRRFRRDHEMGIDDLITDLRGRITMVVRTGWGSMTFGMAGFFGVYFILFWRCLGAVGVNVSFAHMFAAYAVGRLLTAVGITPGGIGITESGTVAVLIGLGADPTPATAGVVLFSIYTHLLEIPLGALGWLAWSLTPRRQIGAPAVPEE